MRTIKRVFRTILGCGLSIMMVATSQAAPTLIGVPADVVAMCGTTVAVSTVTATSTCVVVAPTSALLLHYSFDSSNTTAVADDSGNGLTGTVVGATWTPAGRSGGAYSFDGNDRINVGKVIELSPTGVSEMTVSVWLKAASNALSQVPYGEMTFVGRQNSTDYRGWILKTYYGRAFMDVIASYPQISYVEGTFVCDGTWHHVAGCYRIGTNVMATKLFIDGRFVGESTRNGTHASVVPASDLWLGLRPTSMDIPLVGTLDDVRIYGRILSTQEIQAVSQALNVQFGELVYTGCPKTIVRTWSVTDSCGETAVATQTVTLVDNVPPVLSGVPVDVDRPCGAALPPWPAVTALDACSGARLVQATQEVVSAGCPGSVARRWVATDACGNSVSATQTIRFLETTNPPVLVGVPSNMTVTCGSIPAPALVTATSLCSTAIAGDMVFHFSFDQSNATAVADLSGHGRDAQVQGARWVPNGRWGGAYAFDGNDRLVVGDVANLGPMLTAMTVSAWAYVPSNSAVSEMMLVGREQEAWPYTGWSLRTYQTRPFADIIGTYPQRTMSWAPATLADDAWHHVCGVYTVGSNSLSCKLFVDGTLVDDDLRLGAYNSIATSVGLWIGARAPDVSTGMRGLLDEIRVYGRELAPHEVVALAYGAPPVVMTETVVPGCPRTVTRVWTAEDGCGQCSSATQIITVVDTRAPTLQGVPGDMTWACGATLPSPAVVSAYDDCDGQIDVTYHQVMAATGCPAVVERRWTAVDACGNGICATQLITLVEMDSRPALVGVPPDVVVPCDGIPSPALVSATSTCSAANEPDLAFLYYSFDSSNAVSVLDQSGNGRNATVVGARWVPAGYRGGAYEFDGNDRINLGQLLDLDRARTAITVSVWARIPAATAVSEMVLAAKQQEAAPYTGWSLRTYVRQAMGDVIASYPQQSLAVSSNMIADGLWHHVCGVFTRGVDQMRALVYVDGVPVADRLRAGAFGNTITPAELWLGARSPGGSMGLRGLLDEVRIYDRALVASEIGVLQRGGVPVTMDETVSGYCPSVIQRVWTATDACGRSVAATQRIVVVDHTPPRLINVPAAMSLTCGSPLPVAPVVTALDDCGKTVAVAYVQSGLGACLGSITRTWSATDLCGNSTAATQVIEFLPANTTNGLVLRYTFDEDGNVAVDSSGSGYHGVITGGAWIASSNCHGGARRFDADGWVNAGNVADLGGARTSLTVLARIRGRPTVEGMCIVGKSQDSAPYTGWALRIVEHSRMQADVIATYPQRSFSWVTNDILDGEWHVVGGVFTTGPGSLGTKAYLDGFLTDSDGWSGSHSSTAPAAPLTIAARAPGYSEKLNGMIDEIRMYDRELSAAEVAAATAEMSACSEAPASIRCIIEPDAAVLAGARWRVSSGATNAPWLNSGDSIDAPPGVFSLEFSHLPNWTTPSAMPLEIESASARVVTARYVAVGADLVPPAIVDIQPPPGSVGLAHSAVMNLFVTDNVAVAYVTVNGEIARLLNDSHYQVRISGLCGEFNDFLVKVVDTSGNVASTNVTYGQAVELELRALWAGVWQVRNPHAGDVAFQWRVVGNSESGNGVVPANSDIRFTTSTGRKTVEILVGGVVVDRANSSQSPAPDDGDERHADSDGDGMTNEEEDFAGTDSNDEASNLKLLSPPVATGAGSSGIALLSAIPDGTGVDPARIVSFASSSNHVYSLEYSADLKRWDPVLDFVRVPGVGGTLTYTNRFDAWPINFRIRATKRP